MGIGGGCDLGGGGGGGLGVEREQQQQQQQNNTMHLILTTVRTGEQSGKYTCVCVCVCGKVLIESCHAVMQLSGHRTGEIRNEHRRFGLRAKRNVPDNAGGFLFFFKSWFRLFFSLLLWVLSCLIYL